MDSAAIILAAGRGSRMLSATENRPKCLVELAGRPLLHWQLDALRMAGIEKIVVVRGYKGEAIAGEFETVENPRWEETNMFFSLLCADSFVQNFFASGGQHLLVAYSDIVYHPEHVQRLLQQNSDIAITYDRDWQKLWQLRFDNILDDAETFLQENGRLLEIGGKAGDISEIHGQYMGLLAFTRSGWQTLKSASVAMGAQIDKTDMTAFLRLLLENNVAIATVPVRGKWCESDNENDLRRYEEALKQGGWCHDWRYANETR